MKPEALPRILSAAEEALIRAVWRYPYLTALDAMHLLGLTSVGHVRRLLSTLAGEEDAENCYLLSLAIPDRRVGGVERCFVLARKGREVAAALGLPVSAYFRPGSKTRVMSFSHLSHEILVNRTVLSGVCFSRDQTAFNLVDVRLGPEVAAAGGTLPALPDAWMLWVSKEGKKYPIWIEIDNATEYFKRFSQLLKARVECLTSGAYSRAFPEAEGAVVIAYVAAGPPREEGRRERRDLLRRWTMRVLQELEMERWGSVFRFSALPDDLYAAPIFAARTWYRVDSDVAVSLLPA